MTVQRSTNPHGSAPRSRPVGGRLGEILVANEVLRKAVSQQLNVAYVDLDKTVIDPSLEKIVTAQYARRRMVVPIARIGQTLTVAMDDPTVTETVDELHRLT